MNACLMRQRSERREYASAESLVLPDVELRIELMFCLDLERAMESE